jgi:signal transduction histidine kinase
MSKLAEFIRANVEPILAEWETFARAIPTTTEMNIAALRDHAKDMLAVIAEDLEQPQTAREQQEKARGESDADGGDGRTAAQEHGAGRAESGFTVEQMVSEFRALRASVVHLWSRDRDQATANDLRDLTRFNEAIDQAISESITTYVGEVRLSKERFLAILAHDLRTPLSAIITSTGFMLEEGNLAEQNKTLVSRVRSSARRMNRLVADLLEFTRTRFGDTLPAARVEMDMAEMVNEVATEVRASHPDADIVVRTSGDLRGHWDADRLAQAITNLVANAAQHGDLAAPIHVTAVGEDAAEVRVVVQNRGSVIPPETLAGIFEPMKEGGGNARDRRHLGLGLYIAHKIVVAHGGAIEAQSSAAEGTSFTVRLPRVAEDPG